MGFNDLADAAKSIVIVGIFLTIGFIVFSQGNAQIGDIESIDETNTTQCLTSASCNGTTAVINGINDFPDWLSLIVIIMVGATIMRLMKMFN